MAFFDYESEQLDASGATAVTEFSFKDVPPQSTITVSPGAGGGTVEVFLRTTPNGPLIPWPAGAVTAAASMSTSSPYCEVRAECTAGLGLVELAVYRFKQTG
jgi:hypothetical protein